MPGGRWATYSFIARLRSIGALSLMMVRGAMNDVLAPELRPGDIVIGNNLSTHKDPDVVAAIRAAGARLEFAPPYLPELDPIEEARSKVKTSFVS